MEMDMEMSTSVPWLDMPLMLHSSRETTCTMTPEQCAYKGAHWRNWYVADWVYAHNTVYFAVAMIALFTISRLVTTMMPATLRTSGPFQRLTSTARYLSYRSYRVKALNWYTAPAGLLLLTGAALVFFFGMTFGPKPYYWPTLPDGDSYGDSQPLATRSGWMAVALLPFVIVLPTKMNFITTVTGIPHEKLQFFHRWSAYIMFVLALLHTFPFIIHSIAMGEMVMNWQTSVFYWTGVVALLAQAWLTLFSNEYIRNRFYEIFKATHIVAAIVFVVFFFIHCDYTLTSWDYFIAAGVLYVSSYLLAALRTFHEHGFRKAHVSVLPNNSIRIAIPSHADWTPGQHAFLRFPTLGLQHAFTSHPFTLCSLDTSGEMVFFVKPRGGLTARLARACLDRPAASLSVLVDGPYGGIGCRTLAGFDKAVIIAGGSGAGFALPLIEDVLRRRCLDASVTTQLEVVLSTRELETATWFRSELTALFARYKAYEPEQVPAVAIHLTRGAAEAVDASAAEKGLSFADHGEALIVDGDQFVAAVEKQPAKEAEELAGSASDSASSGIEADAAYAPSFELHHGRPVLRLVVRNEVQRSTGRVGVAVCGPQEMLYDVGNAAAAAQVDILRGQTACRELYLHTEHFGL